MNSRDSLILTLITFGINKLSPVFPIYKNYLNSYQTLSKHFNQFSDAGTYHISLSDLVKVLPRKSSRSISTYAPLVKYLKEYHAITLQIID